jgi:hypothetical protein
MPTPSKVGTKFTIRMQKIADLFQTRKYVRVQFLDVPFPSPWFAPFRDCALTPTLALLTYYHMAKRPSSLLHHTTRENCLCAAPSPDNQICALTARARNHARKAFPVQRHAERVTAHSLRADGSQQ